MEGHPLVRMAFYFKELNNGPVIITSIQFPRYGNDFYYN